MALESSLNPPTSENRGLDYSRSIPQPNGRFRLSTRQPLRPYDLTSTAMATHRLIVAEPLTRLNLSVIDTGRR